MAGSVDIPPYSKFFNEFLNINERFFSKGCTAIDIGAHDGDTTLPISTLTAGGKTYAFECAEAFITQFGINLAYNPTLDIEAVPFALMPTSGIHEFLYCAGDDYNGGHPSTNSWVGTYKIPRLVRGINFFEYFANKDLSKLAFVKIDTEGHDFHILWSFKEALKSLRPVIHAEWFPRTDPFIYQVITHLGYEIYCGYSLEPLKLGESQWRQDIILVPSEKIVNFGLKNYLKN